MLQFIDAKSLGITMGIWTAQMKIKGTWLALALYMNKVGGRK